MQKGSKDRNSLGRHLYTNLPTENGDLVAIGKYQAAVKLTPKEFEGVERLVKAGYFLNISDFVRSAVRDKLEATKPVLVRRISPRAARKEVYLHVKSHSGIYPDEVADALNLSLETVMEAVSALMLEGKIGEFT